LTASVRSLPVVIRRNLWTKTGASAA